MAIKKQIGFTLLSADDHSSSIAESALTDVYFSRNPEDAVYYTPSISIGRYYTVRNTTNGDTIGGMLSENGLSFKKEGNGQSVVCTYLWGSDSSKMPPKEGVVYIGCRLNRNSSVAGSPAYIYGKFMTSYNDLAWWEAPATSDTLVFVEFEIDFTSQSVSVYYNDTKVSTLNLRDMDQVGIRFGNFEGTVYTSDGNSHTSRPYLPAVPTWMYMSSYYFVHDLPSDQVKTGRLGRSTRVMSYSSSQSYTATTTGWKLTGNTDPNVVFLNAKKFTVNAIPPTDMWASSLSVSTPAEFIPASVEAAGEMLSLGLYAYVTSEDPSTPAKCKLKISDSRGNGDLVEGVYSTEGNLPSVASTGVMYEIPPSRGSSLTTLNTYKFSIECAPNK